MTVSANPDPIRIPFDRHFGEYIEITHDIARQIVAMVVPEDMQRMCVDLDMTKMHQRIAALEAHREQAAAVARQDYEAAAEALGRALEARPCPHPASVTDEDGVVRCDQCQAVIWEHQPAQPQGDEAAVEAMDRAFHSPGMLTSRDRMWRILAALRSGAIRLPEDAPQIAALRATLASTEISGSQAIERLRAERDKALADLAAMTKRGGE